MADNRSLDEFVATDEREEPEPSEPAAVESEPVEAASTEIVEETEVDPEVDGTDEPIEPMAETFAWSAAGGECARCGEVVEERWRDGDDLVCPNCKAW